MATDVTTDTIRISAIIPATPERVYGAWLDSEEHSAITHSTAGIEPWVGGRHSAWGGSIRGTTLELQPNRRIVQTWWASDFPPGSEESRLEVLFEPVEGGTLVTINHTGLPQGRGHRYEDGWKDFYLNNMKEYFPAHAVAPAGREETMATAGQTRMDMPSGGTAAKAAPAAAHKVAKKPARAKSRPARARKKAVAKRPTAKKKGARKPAARKAARKPAARKAAKKPARAKSRPARARKAARRPARKAVRAASARKKTGRGKPRRGR